MVVKCASVTIFNKLRPLLTYFTNRIGQMSGGQGSEMVQYLRIDRDKPSSSGIRRVYITSSYAVRLIHLSGCVLTETFVFPPTVTPRGLCAFLSLPVRPLLQISSSRLSLLSLLFHLPIDNL